MYERAKANGESAEQIARLGKRFAALAEREHEIAAATQLLSSELAEDREREQREAIAATGTDAERTRAAYSGTVQAARAKLESFAREFTTTYDGLARTENDARMAWDAAMRAAGRDRLFQRFEEPNLLSIDEAVTFFHVAAMLARYGGSQHVPVPHAVVPPSLATSTSSGPARRETAAPSSSDDAIPRHIAARNAEAQSRPNPLRAPA